ncbi:MAG: AAA family ATPase [Promethearchaeota archaeon]
MINIVIQSQNAQKEEHCEILPDKLKTKKVRKKKQEIIHEKQKPTTQKILPFNVIYPNKNQQTYYPVLEFEGEKKKKINELELIRLAVERDRLSKKKHVSTFYFFSPPGLGKTVLGAYLALCYNCPYQIINCVNSMIDLDLLGSQILIGDGTKWQDGPIPSIIRAANHYKMGILIINELNALTVNAQMALNPLLDKQEGVILTQNNNEFVKLSDNCHLLIIATMNPDVLGINDLQASVRDRASAILEMNYPSIEKESWVIQQITGLDEQWALKYCEVIAECRRAKFIDNTVTKAPSTRAIIDWINYSKVWGAMLAFKLTIANRYCAGNNEIEKKILIRIATGKGVSKWIIPKNSDINMDDLEYQDRFHFPSKEPMKIRNPIDLKKKNLTSRQRKEIKQQKLAKKLNLIPLDNFLVKKNEKHD